MKKETNIDNRVFGYTIMASALFIVSALLLTLYISKISHYPLADFLIPITTGIASITLFYKAVKNDHRRLI